MSRPASVNRRRVRRKFMEAHKSLLDTCIGAYSCLMFDMGLPALLMYKIRIEEGRSKFIDIQRDFLALVRGRVFYDRIKFQLSRFRRHVRLCHSEVRSEIIRLRNL